jgi:hypothetical protein
MVLPNMGAIQTTHTTFIIILGARGGDGGGGNSLNYKINSPSKFVITPLLCDLKDMYGAIRKPYQYLSWLAPLK